MDQKQFQDTVIEKLERLDKGFTHLFGDEGTNDPGQLHYIKQKLSMHDKRIEDMEKLKQFGKGAIWGIGFILSSVFIGIYEIVKHIFNH